MKLFLHFMVLCFALCATAAIGKKSGPIPLTRLSMGDIGGWIELSVEANGRSGRWLIDTGSTRNLVSVAFAKRHGLATRSSVTANTALGKIEGAEVLLPTLRVGTLERSRQTALVLDLSLVVGDVAEGIDGILGVPFFNSHVIYLDLRKWSAEISKGSSEPCPKGMSHIEVRQHQGLPVIDVAVNSGNKETLLLDTGNPAGLVRVISRAPSASPPGIKLTDSALLNLARRVRIGGQLRANVPVVQLHSPVLKRALGERVSGLAGTALLDDATLFIDLARKRACFENGIFPVPGGFGLTLAQRDGVLYVGKVLPGGPAQDAGLHSGDVVQNWVGRPPVGDLPELWSRVQGLEEIDLVVGEDARRVRLRRAYFAPQLP